ncbi:sugar ABC transporter permease [Thermoanaerobaculum aquaticum]|uniref:Sugar ABC transporter permease n=1 Tax=Thermoanaerobaculum aquaticum TaxID=1312852 RepID=A0A062XTI4_9BACT|nr:sugar ABC transporter permease [Thermoanaerobaculum aquaticum]KDA54168.1 sugar ABC transporter permease [Thermoanaerobaculum aquaticum]
MKEHQAGWLFVAPALLLVGLFFVLPVVVGLALSLTDFDIYGIGDLTTVRFVAFANYSQLAGNPLFWQALKNTAVFVLLGGILSILLALASALALASRLTVWPSFFRTVYFAPVVMTLVAAAVVFRYLYHPDFGLLNRVLGLFGVSPVFWLGDPRYALLAIILLATWKNFGANMVVLLAGLGTIPESLYEAAKLDGASAVRIFWHVTLPGLRPTLLFVSLTTVIGYFQLFAEPYVMTGGGGPNNATLSLVLHMYKEGFRWWNLGYAAAVAVVLTLIIAAASTVLWLVQRKKA